MIAFAANSVLNRMALAEGAIDPAGFALIRVVSGAVALAVMVWARDHKIQISTTGKFWSGRFWQVIGLTAYVMAFSLAYLRLDAGVGALILFGGVQVTMFAAAFMQGEQIPRRRAIGAVFAMAGLAYVLWPNDATGFGDLRFGALMLVAALGWGIYSLLGRGAGDPLRDTAVNFIFAAPLCGAIWLILPGTGFASLTGVILASVSGVITSGMGYALWYRVLPQITASIAAVAQLSVPLIALGGGMIFLGEAASSRFIIGAALVLGGMVLALVPKNPRRGLAEFPTAA